jgi:hypothetical protein
VRNYDLATKTERRAKIIKLLNEYPMRLQIDDELLDIAPRVAVAVGIKAG